MCPRVSLFVDAPARVPHAPWRIPLPFSIARMSSSARTEDGNRGASRSVTARRSSVIYIQKSRARIQVVFFVWLMYATPRNCDKNRARGIVHVDGRDETGVPDYPRSETQFGYSTRRCGSSLISLRKHRRSTRERGTVTVLASMEKRYDASILFSTRYSEQLSI